MRLFSILVCLINIWNPSWSQQLPRINQVDNPQTYSIDPNSLPPPFATSSARRGSLQIPQPHDATLNVPKGFTVNIFSSGEFPNDYQKPRQMALTPNGDIFLTDMEAGDVFVLRDNNNDGVADERFTFATGLTEPFGLTFSDGFLYVADVHSVVRYPYRSGQTKARSAAEKIADLTDDRGHSTRDIKFSLDGSKFFVAVGSTGNVNIERDPLRAAITSFNPDGSNRQTYATGLRNPVSLAVNPVNGVLWTCVNERDETGDDLVPDYATSVQEGGFYGWPYSYIGQNPDPRVPQIRPDLVSRAIVPDVLFTSHSAPLGITFYTGTQFPKEYHGDAFVTLHGSWNRHKMTGFKVVRIKFQNGKVIRNEYEDFLTGWLRSADDNTVWGRPVGVVVAADGSLLVSDDGAKKIWRISYCGNNC
ncbi:hypothetical protein RvY_16740 [Ramazzottius varieornatus]|uniref:Pyrroloquinoline quinone-dependent pyranose dehydrogenase beta-propeller domain-containing protein n=1 Tax=Ramazzottius varieornatus TaxID=947166 RepID=A0A1D1VZL1_RAMVA|nr:hypothetical protein RvY_16740 [Ramazzottius varieornatus]